MRAIRYLGNAAIHDQEIPVEISPSDSLLVVNVFLNVVDELMARDII
jgi:hypothetical protein